MGGAEWSTETGIAREMRRDKEQHDQLSCPFPWNGPTFQLISQTTKFGVLNPICRHAANARGPTNITSCLPSTTHQQNLTEGTMWCYPDIVRPSHSSARVRAR